MESNEHTSSQATDSNKDENNRAVSSFTGAGAQLQELASRHGNNSNGNNNSNNTMGIAHQQHIVKQGLIKNDGSNLNENDSNPNGGNINGNGLSEGGLLLPSQNSFQTESQVGVNNPSFNPNFQNWPNFQQFPGLPPNISQNIQQNIPQNMPQHMPQNMQPLNSQQPMQPNMNLLPTNSQPIPQNLNQNLQYQANPQNVQAQNPPNQHLPENPNNIQNPPNLNPKTQCKNCQKCKLPIQNGQLVQYLNDFPMYVFHEECFTCIICSKFLMKGDQYSGDAQGNIYCGAHKPPSPLKHEVVGPIGGLNSEQVKQEVLAFSDDDKDELGSAGYLNKPKRPRTILTSDQRRKFKCYKVFF